MRVTLAVSSETVVIVLWFVQPSVRNCIHRWFACDDQTSVADGDGEGVAARRCSWMDATAVVDEAIKKFPSKMHYAVARTGSTGQVLQSDGSRLLPPATSSYTAPTHSALLPSLSENTRTAVAHLPRYWPRLYPTDMLNDETTQTDYFLGNRPQ